MRGDEARAMQVREDLAMQRKDPLQGDLPTFRAAGKQLAGSRRHRAAGKRENFPLQGAILPLTRSKEAREDVTAKWCATARPDDYLHPGPESTRPQSSYSSVVCKQL